MSLESKISAGECYYRWQQQDLLLFCHLQPGARSDEFCGQHGDRLKIRISAAAVDGKANAYLLKFIAKQFGVAKSAVSISSGELSRQKNLLIQQPTKFPDSLNIVHA